MASARGGLLGQFDFFGSQNADGSGFQISPPQGADAHAHKFFDAQAKAGEHLADLALQALFEHDAGTSRRKAGDVLGLGLAFRNADAFQELKEHGVVEVLVECDPVFLFDARLGVRELLSQRAVVRQQQQTFRIGVEAAHVIDVPIARRDQVVDRAVRTLSLAAADEAARLVQEQNDVFFRQRAAAVYLYKIGRKHAHTGRFDDVTVQFNAAFGNQAVGGAARFVAAGGKELVDADAAFVGGMGGFFFGTGGLIFRHGKY